MTPAMSRTALFIRHRARPGCRDEVQRIWEKHVKPRVEANPAHQAYFFCHDNTDPDVVRVFQIYPDESSMKEFLSGAWYPEYIREVSQVVVSPPEVLPTTLVWTKPDSLGDRQGPC